MRTRDEKLDLLRTIPPFESARLRELRTIAAVADVATADAGRVVLRAGKPALEVYVVARGFLDVVVDGSTLATLGPGELVGEVGVLDGEPRTADVVAATDVTLLAIHATAFAALLESSPSLRLAALRQLAERVRRMDVSAA